MTIIYHNPRCRKSRETLALIEEKGIAPEIHLYLENAMPREVLKEAIDTFGNKMLRTGEADFKEHVKGKDGDALLDALLAYPKAIERPLVVHNGKMALGRPPESVLEIL